MPKKKTANEEIAPAVTITETDQGQPEVKIEKPCFTISHHTPEWFSSRARLDHGRYTKREKDLLVQDGSTVTLCDGTIGISYIERMSFVIEIEAGQPDLEAFENEYPECAIDSPAVETSTFTKGTEYGIVLSTIGAVLKATSKAHNVRSVLVAPTRKRCLEVADVTDQSYDLLLDLAYTQSYESIVVSVVTAIFGNNLLAASFIRELVGVDCFASDFAFNHSDLPEVSVRKIRDGYALMDEPEPQEEDVDVDIEVDVDAEEIETQDA